MMKSSHRTYSRKRKDTASEKFDAIFGAPDSNSSVVTIKLGNTKKMKREETYTAKIRTSPINGLKKDTAADKFDAIFGAPPKIAQRWSSNDSSAKCNKIIPRLQNLSCKNGGKSTVNKYEDITDNSVETISLKNKKANGTNCKHSVMNERNSDSNSSSNDPSKTYLFGFEDMTPPKIKRTPAILRTPEKKSPPANNKSPMGKITKATMSTVGGRVVLNIQRGFKSPTKSTTDSPVKLVDLSKKSSPVKSTTNGISTNLHLSITDQKREGHNCSQPQKLSSNVHKLSKYAKAPILTTSVSLPVQKATSTTSRNRGATNKDEIKVEEPPYQKPSPVAAISAHIKQKSSTNSKKVSYNSRPWMNKDDNTEEDMLINVS